MTDYVEPVGNALVNKVDRFGTKLVDSDEDEHSAENSEEEGSKSNEFTFQSAIDVGSHFIDIEPSNELIF